MLLAGDFGADMKVRVHVDATAAKGLVERHIEVDNLWIQEQDAHRMMPTS